MAIPGEIKGPTHFAAGKLQQILTAGQEQLTPEEFSDLLQLIEDFYTYGLTNWINCQLGEIISKLDWELDISESAEWHEALCACDEAFLLKELKALCYEFGLGAGGHKKLLCRKLYMADYEPVVAIMQPIIDRVEAEEKVEQMPQTIIETTYEGAAGQSFRLNQMGWRGAGRYSSSEAAIEDAKALGIAVEDITLVESRGACDLYIRGKSPYPQTEPVYQLGNLGAKLEDMRRSDPEKFYRRHRELMDFISQLQR